jgi:hypothetical protein
LNNFPINILTPDSAHGLALVSVTGSVVMNAAPPLVTHMALPGWIAHIALERIRIPENGLHGQLDLTIIIKRYIFRRAYFCPTDARQHASRISLLICVGTLGD